MPCQASRGDNDGKTDDHGNGPRRTGPVRAAHHDGAQDRGEGVDVLLENVGQLTGQDIPQDTAAYTELVCSLFD